MIEFARKAGVEDEQRFTEYLNDSTPVPAIQADMAAVQEIGGTGTPTVMVNGLLIDAGLDSLSLSATIQRMIR